MPDTVLATAGPPPLMRGPSYWMRSYLLMLRWEITSLRMVLPILFVVQMLLGAGVVVGLGLLFDQVAPTQALYLATGATVISLLLTGLVAAPQLVANQKMSGTYDYLWSLPVPRLVEVMASLTVYAVVALPGTIVALVVAALRFDLDLSVSPLVIPAAFLTVLMATSVGYGFAHGIRQPMVTGLITQVLAFGILLYSPINFPADHLPRWYAALHEVLPFEHAAIVMRDGLTEGLVQGAGRSYLILTAWTVAGWLVTWRVLGRRG
ncbi:MAG: ABC transporter permease [Acidobacteriota bacterium]